MGEGFVLIDIRALDRGALPEGNAAAVLSFIEQVAAPTGVEEALVRLFGTLPEVEDRSLGEVLSGWLRAVVTRTGAMEAEEFDEMMQRTSTGRLRGMPEERLRAWFAGVRAEIGAEIRAEGEALFLARERGPLARKAPTGATCPSRPHPRPSHGPGSDVLGARASGPQRAEGPQGADRSDMPEPATPPPEPRPRERCPGSAGLWPATGRRPARRRQERHTRATHSPAQGTALAVVGSPGSARVPSACPCGGPVARCGRDARAPRDGPRASLADPASQGHSKLSARRSMGSCREQVHGLGSDVLGARASGPIRAATLIICMAPGAMSWERGHLARNGPKARKAPTGATCPSHPHPRPRHGPGSDGGLPEAHASRPLAHVAGLWPACGRDARAPGDGPRASLADPAPQGHSNAAARRSMDPCREQGHGLRQGTAL